MQTSFESIIYLDNAASTPVEPSVLSAMLPWLTRECGNPSSLHQAGLRAKEAIRHAAEQVADALHCMPEQILFTSGGSMANQLAVQSAISRVSPNGKLFTTAIEHSSLLDPMMQHAEQLTIGKPDRYGYLTQLPSPDTAFASIQYANNEIGCIQDMKQITAYCSQNDILLHTDAVQAFGQIPIDLSRTPVDFLSISAHKFGGPKGVGALYVKHPEQFSPCIPGSRIPVAGTENVPGIVGLGEAAQLAAKQVSVHIAHKLKLTAILKESILSSIPNSYSVSPENQVLPDILSVCIPEIDSECLLHLLDLHGICASAGSACHAGSSAPSHVLSAIGLPKHHLHSVLRFSVGTDNTEDEIRRTVRVLAELVKSLRTP